MGAVEAPELPSSPQPAGEAIRTEQGQRTNSGCDRMDQGARIPGREG